MRLDLPVNPSSFIFKDKKEFFLFNAIASLIEQNFNPPVLNTM